MVLTDQNDTVRSDDIILDNSQPFQPQALNNSALVQVLENWADRTVKVKSNKDDTAYLLIQRSPPEAQSADLSRFTITLPDSAPENFVNPRYRSEQEPMTVSNKRKWPSDQLQSTESTEFKRTKPAEPQRGGLAVKTNLAHFTDLDDMHLDATPDLRLGDTEMNACLADHAKIEAQDRPLFEARYDPLIDVSLSDLIGGKVNSQMEQPAKTDNAQTIEVIDLTNDLAENDGHNTVEAQPSQGRQELPTVDNFNTAELLRQFEAQFQGEGQASEVPLWNPQGVLDFLQ